MVGFQPQLLFEKNNCAKLGGIIFDVKSVVFTLNNGMASRYTNIVDSDLGLVASSQLELSLLRGKSESTILVYRDAMPLLSVKPTDFTSKIIPPSLAQLFFSKIS
jgi:hypothetical protein